ncbi:MAG: hypothetical protein VKP57_01325, partial [Candidatus Sericytochromatia bacterium]|nr:hypothetical protein [Candidatus Sericytochromatia bacterium]
MAEGTMVCKGKGRQVRPCPSRSVACARMAGKGAWVFGPDVAGLWLGDDGQGRGAAFGGVPPEVLAPRTFGSGIPGLARRKPMLLLRLSGLLLRFAARVFDASLFHAPPRMTRFEPLGPLAAMIIRRTSHDG